MLKTLNSIAILIIAIFTINIIGNIRTVVERIKLNQSRIETLETQIEELKTIKNKMESIKQKVVLTAYHPPSKGINADSDHQRTAIMKRPKPGYTLAISKELVHLGWLGRKIYIEGWGVGLASDRMSSNLKGKRIDVCLGSLKEAKKFGKKNNILAIVLE